MLLSETIFADYQPNNELNLLFCMMESYIRPPTLTPITYRTLNKSKYLAIIPLLPTNPTCREIKGEYFGTNETLIPEGFTIVPTVDAPDHTSLFQLKEKVEQR